MTYIRSLETNFKNRIINGDFSVWQRGTSATSVGINGYFTADRWKTVINTGTLDYSKSTMNGFNSLRATVSGTPDLLAVLSYLIPFQYNFEGSHLYDLAIQGKTITVSFWFKSNVTGEFTLSLHNFTDVTVQTQSYVTTFTYSTADTPQKFEISIPLQYTWNPALLNNNTVGFVLRIAPLGSSEYQTSTLNTWVDSNPHQSTTSVNWAATLGNYVEIAQVQLEEGSVATEFEYVPYDIQLLRCMRYYEIITLNGHMYEIMDGSTERRFQCIFRVPKRVSPTVTLSTATDSLGNTIQPVVQFVNSHIVHIAHAVSTATDYVHMPWVYVDAEL